VSGDVVAGQGRLHVFAGGLFRADEQLKLLGNLGRRGVDDLGNFVPDCLQLLDALSELVLASVDACELVLHCLPLLLLVGQKALV